MCIFCGRQADSNEHIFSDWINEVIKVDCVDAHAFLVEGRQTTHERSYHAKKVAAQEAKVVCGDCNHGWMSDLEDEAKPILVPMITGNRTRLDYKAQLVIAHWAIKTAMVAESIQHGANTFTQDDRYIVRVDRRPSLRARVNIAAYDMSTPNMTRYTRGQGPVLRNGEVVAEFYVHAIQVQHLVLSVRGTQTFPAADNRSLERLAQPAFREVPVFPPVEVCEWPPNQVMDEPTFLEYTGANNVAPHPAKSAGGLLSFNPAKVTTDYPQLQG